MHLLIPFAAPGSDTGRLAVHDLTLPHLADWIAESAPPQLDVGDELSFTPPHERALAAALGLGGGDGELPWGAHLAAGDGIDTGDLAWGLLTPAHWQVGAEQVTLADPDLLDLDEATARGLLEAVRDLFEEEGFVLDFGAPQRWYLAHESLAGLRSASVDRVVGRNVKPWLPAGAPARLLQRLQSEVQMRWYEHPLNGAREAKGQVPVNSFWLSGCGSHRGVSERADLQVDPRLRGPALAEDWSAWQAAWRALDAGPLAELLQRQRAGRPAQLTLCGERVAAHWSAGRGSAWRRLAARLRRSPARAFLEAL